MAYLCNVIYENPSSPYQANPANQINDFMDNQSHNFLKWQILGIYKLNGGYICTASDVPESI